MNHRYAVSAMLVIALSFAGAAASQGQKLTGFEAWSKLVGNTINGKVDGKDHHEYYMGNGTAKNLQGSKITTGKWVLEGANVCLTYPGTGKECYVIEVVDDVATFTSKTHGTWRVNILQGNVKKL